jgi:hypothetical protein
VARAWWGLFAAPTPVQSPPVLGPHPPSPTHPLPRAGHIAALERVSEEAVILLKPDALYIVGVSQQQTMMAYSHLRAFPQPETPPPPPPASSGAGGAGGAPSQPPPAPASFTCPPGGIFSEYIVENRRGAIPLQFTVANLLAGLRPARQRPSPGDLVVLKLVKRGATPFLAVEVRSADAGLVLTHDIPVKLMPAESVEKYAAPSIPLPRVRMFLPDPTRVAAVLERMRSLSKVVTLEGDMGWGRNAGAGAGGEGGDDAPAASLSLAAAADCAAMQTFFRELAGSAPPGDGEEGAGAGAGSSSSSSSSSSSLAASGRATALVDLRDFLTASKAVSAFSERLRGEWLLGLLPGRAVFLHLDLPGGASDGDADGDMADGDDEATREYGFGGTVTFLFSVKDDGEPGGEDGERERGSAAGGGKRAAPRRGGKAAAAVATPMAGGGKARGAAAEDEEDEEG